MQLSHGRGLHDDRTSALVDYEVDGAINMYSGIYNNPFHLGKI
ncbi:MAG: hypothetical protein ACLVJ6_14245 [Merdibacter sp.]